MDGNLGTNFDPGAQCAHSQEQDPSWWWVDLGSDNVPISEVLIVNRFSPSDGIRQRNKDYVLTLGQSFLVPLFCFVDRTVPLIYFYF